MMRRYICYTLGLVLSLVLPLISFAQMMSSPESVLYDSTSKRYLISNAGNGNIVSLDSNGKYTIFIHGGEILQNPKGMVIAKGKLYVTDVNRLISFNAETGSLISETVVPGSQFLNDLCFDGKDSLFITDMSLNRIFVFNCTDENIGTLVLSQFLNRPNGILYDTEKKSLIIVSYIENAPVVSLNIGSLWLSTLINTSIPFMDGITKDASGNIYISSWGNEQPGNGKIYKINKDFQSEPVVIASGLSGPADIYYDTSKNILIVPNFLADSLTFVDLIAPDIPVMVSPEDKQTEVQVKPVLKWYRSDNLAYLINLAKDNDFQVGRVEIKIQASSTQDTLKIANPLDSGVTYYWRIKAMKEYVESDWSPVWSFTTIKPTSIDDFYASSGITLSPNPANDQISIIICSVAPTPVNISINSVIDPAVGLQHSNFILPDCPRLDVDITSLYSGAYFIKVETNSGVYFRKLMVIK